MYRPEFSAFAVLVVEDDAFVRRSIVRMLRAMGFVEVKEAADGEAALQTLKAMPQCGVVLCDIGMKPVGGLQFLERLRKEFIRRCRIRRSSSLPARRTAKPSSAR